MPSRDPATTTVGERPPEPRADRSLLIDGRLVSTDGVFASINPATGDVIGHAPDAGLDEAEAAIAAARRAFDTNSWSTDVSLRIRCLDQLHQALLDHADELRELAIAEVGATRALTHGPQLYEPIEIVRYYADLSRTYGGNYFGADSPYGGFKQSGVGREMGVAGLEEFLESKTFAVPVVGVA